MSEENYPSTIVDRLIIHRMDEFLQTMFLCLDLASLKNCSCVSKLWNCVIQELIWNSKKGKRVLAGRNLRWLWRTGSGSIREIEIGEKKGFESIDDVWTLYCDETNVYSITASMELEVYDIESGSIKCVINIGAAGEDSLEKVSVGGDIIATLTGSDLISIWKNTGEKCFESRQRCSVDIIKVIRNAVVIGCRDASSRSILILGETENGGWEVKREVDDMKGEESDIVYTFSEFAFDGDWLISGNEVSSKVWGFPELAYSSRIDAIAYSEDGETPNMILHHPYLFVVGDGGENSWTGVEVWNVEKNTRMRHIPEEDGEFLYFLASNGLFLATVHNTNEINTTITLLDIKELVDDSIGNDELWRETLTSPGESDELNFIATHRYYGVAMNKTCLIIAHKNKMEILKFRWTD